jgi:hypothetical protein
VNLHGNDIIVKSFQGDKNFVCKMLDGICIPWPKIVVGFEMEPKIWEMAGDSSAKIGFGYDTFSTSLEKGAEMVQSWTNGHGKDPVAV